METLKLSARQVMEMYIILQLMSAAAQSLPEPQPGQIWYGAFYKFVTIIIGDFKSFATAVMGGKTLTQFTGQLADSNAKASVNVSAPSSASVASIESASSQVKQITR